MAEGRDVSMSISDRSSLNIGDEDDEDEVEADEETFDDDDDIDDNDNDFYYKMDSSPRGICLIINNRDFVPTIGRTQLETRTGTDFDRDALKCVFEGLGFSVELHDNLTSSEMLQTVLRAALLKDHSSYDCFVCCLLSHGCLGQVFGTDCCGVEIKELTSAVKPQVCPSLSGKPKLFFIQACQGDNRQTGFPCAASDAAPGTDDLIPNEADFLLSYSSVPGFKSFRDPNQGSFYVNKLTRFLAKFSQSKHILEILTKVNNAVTRQHITWKDNDVIREVKQSPAPLFTLRKVLFFNSAVLSQPTTQLNELGVQLTPSGPVPDSAPSVRYIKKGERRPTARNQTGAGSDVRDDAAGSGCFRPRDTSLKEKRVLFDTKKLRHLRTLARKASQYTDYRVVVTTSDVMGAGTDAKVSVELIGKNNVSTGAQQLKKSDTHKNPFERNNVDVFTLRQLPNVGQLQNLRVCKDNRWLGSDWHLASVEVEDMSTHTRYIFTCNTWLNKTHRVVDLPCVRTALFEKTAAVCYRVVVVTGDEVGAGTDSNVFITIHGISSDTGKRPLTKKPGMRNLFERGQEDVFEINAIDQGPLSKIRVEHDNSGLGPAWFLQRVEVTNCKTRVLTSFPCGRWLRKDDKKGDVTFVELASPT